MQNSDSWKLLKKKKKLILDLLIFVWSFGGNRGLSLAIIISYCLTIFFPVICPLDQIWRFITLLYIQCCVSYFDLIIQIMILCLYWFWHFSKCFAYKVLFSVQPETPLLPIRKIDSLRKDLSIKSLLHWNQSLQSLPDLLNPHLYFLLAANHWEDATDRSEQNDEAERGDLPRSRACHEWIYG